MDVRAKGNQQVLPGFESALVAKPGRSGSGTSDDATRQTARKQARKGERSVWAFATQLGFFGDYKSYKVRVVSNTNLWSRLPNIWKRKQSPFKQIFGLVARSRNG